MYYVDRGHGIPIILLHGYLGSAFMWAPQVSAFEDKFRIIAPDIWGHGNSGELPSGTNDLAAVARHILILLDALEVERFILFGQSVGGMLAGEIALSMPHRVIALALLDTHLGNEPARTRNYFLGLLSSVNEQKGFSASVAEELERLFFMPSKSEGPSRLKVAFRNQLSALSQERITQSIVPIGCMIFNRRDMSAHLASIDADSTVVICGRYDSVRPPDEARTMAALISCQYVEIPDAGHTPNLESPESVTCALAEFIDRVLGGELGVYSEKENAMSEINEAGIIEIIRSIIAEEINVDKDDIDINLPISKLELDSISVTDLCVKLEKLLNKPVKPYMAWDYPTIAKMAAFLAS